MQTATVMKILLFLRKARTGRQRQGFLLIELIMALFLFVLVVGVASRLVSDMVRMESAQMMRCALLRLAQMGAESAAAQRQALADAQRGALHIVFKTQRAAHGVQRTQVHATHGPQQTVQLIVVDP